MFIAVKLLGWSMYRSIALLDHVRAFGGYIELFKLTADLLHMYI